MNGPEDELNVVLDHEGEGVCGRSAKRTLFLEDIAPVNQGRLGLVVALLIVEVGGVDRVRDIR